VAGAAGRLLPLVLIAATLVWLLSLRRHARAGPGLVLAVALLIRLPFLFSDIHSGDLHRYVWEGRIQHHGLSPYAHSPDDPALAHLRGPNHEKINHPELVTIYPPLAQMLFRVSATGLGEIGLRNLMLLLDCAVILVLFFWLRSTKRPPGWLMVYAWCPLALSSAATGHIDPLMLLCLVGFAWAQEREKPHSAAALLGLAILSKTVAVLLVPWLVVRRPRAALTLGVVVLLGYAPYLGSGNPLGSLLTFGSEYAFNASLFRLLEGIGPGARIVAAGLLALWIAWVALTQPRVACAGALALAGLLLLSPTVHVWYLTWFLVLLPAVGPRRWTWPLIAWCATAVLAMETYRRTYAGEEFRELYWMTALAYLAPILLAAWLLRRAWPAPSRTTEAAPGVPTPEFDVVIPCRGESENLRSLLPRWLETGAKQVIVADTPTGDGTRELCSTEERLLYLPVGERGYGAAVLAGLATARAEHVVICDADHDLGPRQVSALLGPLEDPEVGLVTAARADTSGLSLPQRFGNGLATMLIALGWGRRFADLGPFRALRRSAWPEGALRDRGYGFNVEMNVRALEEGMRVIEVSLPAGRRVHGDDRISGTLRGVLGAGSGILLRLYRLREDTCRPLQS
jgi:hypothetical protein